MSEELQGANVGEVAEPSTEVIENEAETGQEDIENPELNEEPEQPEQQEQPQRDLEKDSAYAEARRAKEEAEMLRRRLQNYESKVRQYFGDRGINNLDGYFEAVENTVRSQGDFIQQERQKLEQQISDTAYQMQQQGYDDMVINMWVDNQRIKFDNWAMKQEREQEKKLSQQIQSQQQYLTQLNKDFEAMKKKYPGVVKGKGEDLSNFLANSPDLYQYMINNPGITFKAAFLELYEDQILDHSKKAATQKALKQVNSKNHLGTEKSGTGDLGMAIEVSDEQMGIWKKMFPGETDAQLKKRMSKYQKKKGR